MALFDRTAYRDARKQDERIGGVRCSHRATGRTQTLKRWGKVKDYLWGACSTNLATIFKQKSQTRSLKL